ncbi:MAG TPA: DNA alkylation repair protein [Sediminibacterium sp.]|nr:DNA alkylation repair protein [Sediminibacterium sp.]
MRAYLHPLITQFQQHANAENATGMKAYMLHQFDFAGIKTPLRDSIVHPFLKEHQLTKTTELEKVVRELWKMDQRELQYAAIDVFKAHHSIWKPRSIQMIEYCITHKSWWDTVDGIASEWLWTFFNLFPALKIPVTEAWNRSDNIWLQRSSLLFQKPARKNTDTRLLSTYILHLSNSKEFFIQKAIGWALREYSKTDPVWVARFVAKNKLAPLSKREALKRISG